MEKTLAALGPGLTDKQKRSVEALARAVANKLLHAPSARLRSAGEEGGGEAARWEALASELFGLAPKDPPGSAPTHPGKGREDA